MPQISSLRLLLPATVFIKKRFPFDCTAFREFCQWPPPFLLALLQLFCHNISHQLLHPCLFDRNAQQLLLLPLAFSKHVVLVIQKGCQAGLALADSAKRRRVEVHRDVSSIPRDVRVFVAAVAEGPDAAHEKIRVVKRGEHKLPFYCLLPGENSHRRRSLLLLRRLAAPLHSGGGRHRLVRRHPPLHAPQEVCHLIFSHASLMTGVRPAMLRVGVMENVKAVVPFPARRRHKRGRKGAVKDTAE
ncbi:hypothetical protein TCSYLVIO_010942 [Trypanosoma cruzi]|nr:hypothetical protein TCSYLVIO_010942 [Trypanosoma cruzi]